MNKTISDITALISIFISIMTFVNVYLVMIDSHPSSRGWAEFFALITSVLFVLNSFCLTTIINKAKKTYLYMALICFVLTGITLMAIENYFTLIPLVIVSIFAILISIKLITKATVKQSVIINGIMLAMNCTWGWLMIEI